MKGVKSSRTQTRRSPVSAGQLIRRQWCTCICIQSERVYYDRTSKIYEGVGQCMEADHVAFSAQWAFPNVAATTKGKTRVASA